jgi:hypothetical protein
MIDKLEQRIDALNNALSATETTDDDNLNYFGSLVDDSVQNESYGFYEKSGESVNPPTDVVLNRPTTTFQFKDTELRAMRRFGDGSCITNTNTLNAVQRCLVWVEVCVKDEGRRERNVSYLTRTKEMIKNIVELVADGWKAEEEDYDEIGRRLDSITSHNWTP